MKTPKLFISYSWSNPVHEQWVLDLATELRESGVDVILDKWDLKEGHDAIAFMEKMVNDPEIKKVAIIADEVYVAKADGRKGGVGTETQIISQEVYEKQDQITGLYRKISGTRPLGEMSDTGIINLNSNNFNMYKGKIKQDLLSRFGPYALRDLEIASVGSRPNTRYGIRMDRSRIEIVY